MSSLAGKVVLVTGAGRGIGKALAVTYAEAGAFVACAARTEAELAAVVELIRQNGGNAKAVVADLTQEGQVRRMLLEGLAGFDHLDILVLNAGRGQGDAKSTVADSDPAVWREILEANLLSAYHCAREAIPLLLKSEAGKIIVMGSGARLRNPPLLSAYAAAKAGLWALTKCLAAELKDQRVAVNEIIPGPVLKEHQLTAEKAAEIEAAGGAIELPNGEWRKTPMDLAALAMFLATQPPLGPTGQSFSLLRS